MKVHFGCCLLLAFASASAATLADEGCSKNHYILDDPAACWQEAAALHVARASHTATLLLDGRVLVAGGWGDAASSVEIYDPSTGQWTVAAPLHVARGGHTATRLADGRVLVLGGHETYTPGAPSSVIDDTGEIYDPASDTWTSVAGPLTPRDYFSATLLSDGRVLIVGGIDAWDNALGSCELYDPATGQWAETGSLAKLARPPIFRTRGWAHTATLLQDGRVLLAGGFDNDLTMEALVEADLYDPGTGLWTVAAEMSAAQGYHTATLLTDGRVMVSGGDWHSCDGGVGCVDGLLLTTEMYDPRTNAWAAGPPLAMPHHFYTATLLRDGSVLLVGGERNTSAYFSVALLGEAEASPAPGAPWAPAPSLRTPRSGHTATLLADGSVLVVGGVGDVVSYTPLSSAEIYRPPGDSTP